MSKWIRNMARKRSARRCKIPTCLQEPNARCFRRMTQNRRRRSMFEYMLDISTEDCTYYVPSRTPTIHILLPLIAFIYTYLPSRLLTAHNFRFYTGLKIMSAEHKLTRTHIRPGRRVIIMNSWKKPHTTTHEIFLNSIFKKDPGWARQQEQISPNLERKNKSSPVHHGLITS